MLILLVNHHAIVKRKVEMGHWLIPGNKMKVLMIVLLQMSSIASQIHSSNAFSLFPSCVRVSLCDEGAGVAVRPLCVYVVRVVQVRACVNPF